MAEHLGVPVIFSSAVICLNAYSCLGFKFFALFNPQNISEGGDIIVFIWQRTEMRLRSCQWAGRHKAEETGIKPSGGIHWPLGQEGVGRIGSLSSFELEHFQRSPREVGVPALQSGVSVCGSLCCQGQCSHVLHHIHSHLPLLHRPPLPSPWLP